MLSNHLYGWLQCILNRKIRTSEEKHDDKHADSRRSGVGNTHKTLKKVKYETPEILVCIRKMRILSTHPGVRGCRQNSQK